MAGLLPITGTSARIPQILSAGNAPVVILEQLRNLSLSRFIQGLIDARLAAAEGIGTGPILMKGPEGDTLEFSPEALQIAVQEIVPPPPAEPPPDLRPTLDLFA